MKHIKPIILTGLILSVPAIAMAQYNVGDMVGTTDAEIRTALEAKGYTVLEIEHEDDEIEVEVLIDGVETEIELSLKDGTVLEIDREDDKDDG